MKFNESISSVGSWISSKVQNTNSYIVNTKKELNEKIDRYLESDGYEEDLDELLKNINSLHYKDKCFSHVQDRKERICLKEAQLKKKSVIAVGEGTVAAAVSVASTLPEPSSVLCAAGAGAVASATIVSGSALKILYRRSLNGYESRSPNPA